jgi:uncharacterized protein YbjT (DUF2867 family)
MTSAKRVLVAGATGYLGGYVVREFKSRGWIVRALARSPKKLDGLKHEIDQVFEGKVTDPGSLEGACQGVDVVFSSIGITRQKDGLTYLDVDYQGNLNLLRESQKAGVPKFIYVSVFNADKMKDLEIIQAKLRFEEILKASGLDYTIIRPNGFFSDMLEYLGMAQKGRGYVFGSGEFRANPIHGQDLASVCADAALGDDPEIEVGGPDILSHNQILELAFAACSKPVKISHVPLWLKNLLLAGLRLFTPAKTYGPLEFFMTVLAMDMIAPQYGKQRLGNFFRQQHNNL